MSEYKVVNPATNETEREFDSATDLEIQQILERNGSVEYAMGVADRYAEQSRQALAPLPDSDFKRALLWVPDFVVADLGQFDLSGIHWAIARLESPVRMAGSPTTMPLNSVG